MLPGLCGETSKEAGGTRGPHHFRAARGCANVTSGRRKGGGMAAAQQGFVHPEFLVETEWLAQHLDDPKLRILDCTTHLIPDPKITYQVVPGRADFEKAHIPGAQFAD